MIIEGILIIVVLTFLWFFFLNLKDKWTLRKIRKKYNPNDDKSRQGREHGSEPGRTTGFAEPEYGSKGSVELERRKLLPPTEVDTSGETSSSNGKSDGLTNLFTKLRKK